jgi:TonB-dependent receptor
MYFPKIVLALCILCAGHLSAQTRTGNGTIYGRILDADTGRFMQSADISVEGTSVATISEQGGFYTLNSVPEGEATVVVSYAGYITEKKAVTISPGGQTTLDFDMRLTPSSLSGPTPRAEDKKDDVIMLDKLTVTTERAGNARAFMEQKNSMTMSTVLATDNFGTVQNGNIAEFLRNMPGLSVVDDGDTGEGDQIGIGGMDPKYTGVYMDGARMASGAKGGFDDDSRSFRFDQVSINGIESIEIRRTVTADMDGDAPAGGISMKTKSAFDSKTARLRYDVFLTANSYNMDLERTPGPDDGESIKLQPGFNLTYSTPFNHNTMGLLVQAGWQQDFRENNSADATLKGTASLQELMNTIVSEVNYKNGQTQSTRYDASIRFDWKVSPFARLQVQFGHAFRDTTTFNRNFRLTTGSRYSNSNNSNFLTVMASEQESAVTTRIAQTASYSDSSTDTFTMNFNWKRYRFTFDGNFSWSYAVGRKDPTNNKWFSSINMIRTVSNNGNVSLWGVRSSTDKMDWSFYRGDTATMTVNESLTSEIGNIRNYRQQDTYSIQAELPSDNKQTIPTLKMDLRWDAPTKFPLWFKTGFKGYINKYNAWQPVDASRSALRNQYQYVGLTGATSPGKLGSTSANYDNVSSSSVDYNADVPQLSSNYYRTGYSFDPHLGGNIASLDIPFINQTLLYSMFKEHFVVDKVEYPEGSGIYRYRQRTAENWFYQNPNNLQNDRIANYTGRRDLSETSFAGYLMGETRPWAGWIFYAGARYEFTSQEALTLVPLTRGQTFRKLPQLGPGDEYTDLFIDTMYKQGERTKTTNTYAFLLPSAAAKYNFTPNLTTHLGYSEGFGRLDLQKLADNWRVNDTSMEARAPNPSLKPDHFKTYTAAIEYYFEPAGTFTFTYTYRKWDDPGYEEVLLDGASMDSRTPELQNLIDLYGEETLRSFLDSNYSIYTYLPAEQNNRMMQTLELSYRQRIPAIPGLQIDATFTRIIPNWIKTGSASAPKLATGSIRYTKHNFDIRLSGNWRSRYWQSYGTSGETSHLARLGVHARLMINAEVNYRIYRGFSLYATANNLLNTPTTQYRYSSNYLVYESRPGISLRIGIKGDF